jgi:hypothetical protein
MYRYLVIESNKDITTIQTLIIELFSEYIQIDDMKQEQNIFILYYGHDTDVSFLDVLLNIITETFVDLRIYVSYSFDTHFQRDQHILFIKERLKLIDFNKYIYIDDKVLLMHFLNQIDIKLKTHILRKYAQDQMMLETVKIYLESNQNMSNASKQLFMHRNTLIQRIDKFSQVTGFDIRKFIDAFLIYHLVK